MKRLPELFVFLLAFQIEIRVKAFGSEATFQVPRGCLQESLGSCLAQTLGRPLNLSLKNSSDSGAFMSLAGETLVTRDSFGQYRFEEGAVRVEGDFAQSLPFRLDFLHGKIFAGSGAFSIRTLGLAPTKLNAPGRVWISNESADLRLVLRSGQTLEVPAGFEVWVDGLNSNSEQELGMIQPWDLKAQLRLINGFSLGSKSRRLELAARLKPIAALASVQATQIYRKVAERHIASMDEQDRIRMQSAENQRQAKIRLKKLYFDRTFSR
ncbi:MAG: hypothetical protein JNM39_03930 [Bdellovibrionaceae bacterium]|nr:hypothetical protein [Pseudobdellovibrionaceae bacterium]